MTDKEKIVKDIEDKQEDYIDVLAEFIEEHRNNCNKECNFKTCKAAINGLCRTFILNDLKENLERL